MSFELDKAIALKDAEKRKHKLELAAISRLYRPKIQTSKILMGFILINCSIVEIYSMWLMVHLADLTPLSTLMGTVITESISYAIYCTKSFKESKEEATIALERDKFEASIQPSEDVVVEDEEDEG